MSLQKLPKSIVLHAVVHIYQKTFSVNIKKSEDIKYKKLFHSKSF